MWPGLVDTGQTNRGVVSRAPVALAHSKKVAIFEQLHVFETELRTPRECLSRISVGCVRNKWQKPSSKPNAERTWRRDLQWGNPIVIPH